MYVPPVWWMAKNGNVEGIGTALHESHPTAHEIGEIADWTNDEISVHGIVERFGGFVRGDDGWRAERVVIREFLAPNTEIGLQLEKAFPDVPVRYCDPEIPIPPAWTPPDYCDDCY